ncbi:hypothetical protein [Flavobacterium hydatis]|uniref:DUF4878 domain-containing protein n=1 Tax=Flavobacterium hydatis TaxID=991 RepID=A0A086AH83_FLAHY|nr:hypothetical protein [Flavobacterium hydatis]KFF16047.1 hypothetical protein IW20_11925 [Flavobacterium hydatis]OXA87422.1 hypothetical protein B0A62_22805 [Flavobacterium hydatis]
MKILRIIILFSFIVLSSCSNNAESLDDFSQEIITNIKNNDAEKMYSLFLSPDETALYGFLDGSVSSDEMSNLQSPQQLMDLIIEKGKKNKPFEIKTINQYISHFKTMHDWEQVKYVKTESVLVEKRQVTNLKNKQKVDSDIYDLKIILKLNDKKEYFIKINKAIKLNGRWAIFPLKSFGIEIPE